MVGKLYLDFGETPEKLKAEYMDICEGVEADLLDTIKSDENSDLGKIYFGEENMSR